MQAEQKSGGIIQVEREFFAERISKITPDLFVGEVAVRAQTNWLQELGIENVISILTEEQSAQWNIIYPVDPAFRHTTFHFADHDEFSYYQMAEILAKITGRTLVHCISGSNRSTAVTLCYLVSKGMSPVEAFNHYNSTRGMALAKVYQVTPRMTESMAHSVAKWIEQYPK